MEYTITEKSKGEKFWLNHSQLSSLSFGSQEMAWTGDHKQASDMLARVKEKHKGQRRRFKIEEI